MGTFFNPNNPIMKFLTWVCNIMFLNILFILTSIPLVTIGASLCSLYNCCIKLLRKEDTYIWKDYFSTFKENFKQATLLWLPIMILCGIWTGSLYVVFHYLEESQKMLQIPVWILLYLAFSLIIYAFPLMALYESNTKQLIKNAFLLSLSNVPTTLMILILHLVPVFYASFSWENVIRVFSVSLFFLIGFLAYLTSFFVNHAIEKVENAQGESNENTDKEK